MELKTNKLTQGAMIVAIFGVLLLLNRQTGGLFEETFLFLFPLPMVIFAAKYGWKDSLPVLFCMAITSFLFGTFSTIFYAISEAFIGLVYGSCLYSKKDRTKTVVLLLFLSVVANLLSSVVLASLFGYNLQGELNEMQKLMGQYTDKVNQMMAQQAAQTGQTLPENYSFMPPNMMNMNFFRTMFICSMVLLGIMQGFVTHLLSLIVLKKLRYPVKMPAPLAEFYPPKWSGYLGLGAFLLYYASILRPFDNQLMQDLAQAAGVGGLMYLVCFGFIAVFVFVKKRLPGHKLLPLLAGMLLMMIMPQIIMFVGFAYISLRLHDYILQKVQ